MSTNMNINVHYVTRVEGHGNIVVNIKDGKIEDCKWEVIEAPRFFEGFIRGVHYKDVSEIVSRICGICSIGHTTASIRATEDAFGYKPTEQTLTLRKLLLDGETLQSHILHTYFLAAPDFLGAKSVFAIIPTHLEVAKMALRLKRIANDLCDLIGGRTIHPIREVVGGFTKLPTEKELRELKKVLETEALPLLDKTVDVFASLAPKIPNFTRETEYLGLVRDDEYAFYDGDLGSTDAGRTDVHNYRSWTNEYVVPHSSAKWTKNKRESLMVGALARFNLNAKLLHPKAKAAAEKLGLKPINYNPFMNNIAQVIESVHAVEDALIQIDKLLTKGIKDEKVDPMPLKECHGVGAVEVPRGILIHDYTYDRTGHIVQANCIIPTNQNCANIEYDMKKLVPEIMDKPQEEVQLLLEMLVRAYDPCISCSVHLVKVNFK